MPRIGFEQDSVVGPPQHSVENSNFSQVVFVAAEFAYDLDEEVGLHLLLDPLEL